jgi:hypothetical protein
MNIVMYKLAAAPRSSSSRLSVANPLKSPAQTPKITSLPNEEAFTFVPEAPVLVCMVKAEGILGIA